MKRVLTAVVLAPLVLLAVFRAPLWLFALLVGVVIVLALHEYLAIAKAAEIKPFRWLTYVLALFPIVGWEFALAGRSLRAHSVIADYFDRLAYGPSLRVWRIIALLAPVLFGIGLVFRKELRNGLASVSASAFGILYVAGSLTLLVSLRGHPTARVLIIFVFFSVWAGDIAAYYVGRSIGKHKLAPIVSPNKSWEGAVASVIASVAVAIAVFHWESPLRNLFAGNPWGNVGLLPESHFAFFTESGHYLLDINIATAHAVLLGILTNVAAQFGDLFESALKRGANLKDSGALLPGHGGVLDRIDALLFAIPIVWYYALLTGFLGPKPF